MQWADDVRIETPEQIDVSLEVAGLGSRFVALVLDRIIRTVLWFLISVPLVLLIVFLWPGVMKEAAMIPITLVTVLDLVITLAFNIYFELTWNGQTPGKWVAGIRAVRDSGAPLDFRASCIRNLLRLADLSYAFYALGALVALLNARGQRLGDMAAGTVVIRERALQAPVDPLKELEGLTSDEFSFTGEQLAACSAHDRNILRSFFQRYEEMEPRARHLLALRLADEFTRKTSYQARHGILDGPTAEAFLATLFRDLEARARLG
jgi:uncharacterized RDD family membrane protein YckC